MGLDEKVYKPGMVQARISNAKNHLVSPAGYANNKETYEGDRAAKVPALRDIYQRYLGALPAGGCDGLRRFAVLHIPAVPGPPRGVGALSRPVPLHLVDEYQDTKFLHSTASCCNLPRTIRHVCVVGDDAQSIYSFRGADIDNIL